MPNDWHTPPAIWGTGTARITLDPDDLNNAVRIALDLDSEPPPMDDEPPEDTYFCYCCGEEFARQDGYPELRTDASDYFGGYAEPYCYPCTDDLVDRYEEEMDSRRDDNYYDDEEEGYPRDDAASYEVEINEPDPEPVIPDADAATPPPILHVPKIEGRDPRMLSFEQEVSRGGGAVAMALHRAGLSSMDYMTGYHNGPSSADDFCYVERDASVDGEIIWPKMKLHDKRVAKKFEKGIRVVKELIASNVVSLDMHCGGHMHVDAKGLEMRDVMGLYIMWNHVEDVMFRLAAANWSAHRTQVAYENYSPAARKGLETHRDVWSEMQYGRGSLNLSNLLSARASCHCGATQASAWKECSCRLSKQTVEFRVWNTTANLRKINAYSAMSVAMVEFARQNDITIRDFPERGWTHEREADPAHVKEPFRFVMEDLPLTDVERSNVAYCAERCSLSGVI